MSNIYDTLTKGISKTKQDYFKLGALEVEREVLEYMLKNRVQTVGHKELNKIVRDLLKKHI